MLGARLRSWVETQLGRARRRKHKDAPPPAPLPDRHAQPWVHRLTQQDLCQSSLHSGPGVLNGGATLSSPESAYSTGYSTDGTSPGTAPPPPRAPRRRPPPSLHALAAAAPPPAAPPPHAPHASLPHALLYHELPKRRTSCGHQRSESVGGGGVYAALHPRADALPLSASPSPRQRSRIRTNPWVASAPSPVSRRRSRAPPPHRTPPAPRRATPPRSPRSPRLKPRVPPLSPADLTVVRQNSSCSVAESRSSDDELTLRELLGRYDESYAYERETDILSDASDAGADTDADADTGQDGGDEQEPDELDFIDRSPARALPGSRRRRRRSRPPRSAGATPLARRARRTLAPTLAPIAPPMTRAPHFDSELALLEADREAERKYRELIREAERILVSARDGCDGAGGARSPPHYPRVQMLRAAEADLPRRSVLPAAATSPRFSPKKNHITNFIQNNSPELCRRESRRAADSPLARVPPPVPPRKPALPPHAPTTPARSSPVSCERPQSEPPKRKSYCTPDGMPLGITVSSRQQMIVQTLEELKRNLEQQSARLQAEGRSCRRASAHPTHQPYPHPHPHPSHARHRHRNDSL